MKKKLTALALAVLMSISTFVTTVLATDKPHGSPAAPTAEAADDWREDYAYTLGVQAAVFTYHFRLGCDRLDRLSLRFVRTK